MHAHRHVHHSGTGTRWSPANVALALLIALLLLTFVLLFLIMTATPAQAQQAVPPTTTQSAQLPQFAAKLGHRAQLPTGAHQGASGAESLLYTFTNKGDVDGYSSGGLVEDRHGNVCTRSAL